MFRRILAAAMFAATFSTAAHSSITIDGNIQANIVSTTVPVLTESNANCAYFDLECNDVVFGLGSFLPGATEIVLNLSWDQPIDKVILFTPGFYESSANNVEIRVSRSIFDIQSHIIDDDTGEEIHTNGNWIDLRGSAARSLTATISLNYKSGTYLYTSSDPDCESILCMPSAKYFGKGGSIHLRVAEVPEPGAIAAALGGLAIVVGLRGRRQLKDCQLKRLNRTVPV